MFSSPSPFALSVWLLVGVVASFDDRAVSVEDWLSLIGEKFLKQNGSIEAYRNWRERLGCFEFFFFLR